MFALHYCSPVTSNVERCQLLRMCDGGWPPGWRRRRAKQSSLEITVASSFKTTSFAHESQRLFVLRTANSTHEVRMKDLFEFC